MQAENVRAGINLREGFNRDANLGAEPHMSKIVRDEYFAYYFDLFGFIYFHWSAA